MPYSGSRLNIPLCIAQRLTFEPFGAGITQPPLSHNPGPGIYDPGVSGKIPAPITHGSFLPDPLGHFLYFFPGIIGQQDRYPVGECHAGMTMFILDRLIPDHMPTVVGLVMPSSS